MARPRINFDQQASAPLPAEVVAAMLPFLETHYGNPSSLHQEGLRARDAIEEARQKILRFIGGEGSGEIIFTSSGSEALNLAIKGGARANQGFGREILLGDIEHPAVLSSARELEDQGFTLSKIPVDQGGGIAPCAIAGLITDQTNLVIAQHSNQDVGTIQSIEEIAEVCGEHGKTLVVDATGSAGWIPINVSKWGTVLVALSARSFGGPRGMGALYRHRRARLKPQITGGNQENGLRAGTENIPGIVGMGAAAEWAASNLAQRAEHAAIIQRAVWSGIKSKIEQIKLNGPEPGPDRLPNHLNVSIAHVEGEGVALSLDMKGIGIGSGAACTTKSMRIPPVLAAIGVDELYAKGNIILTFGQTNTMQEAEQFLEIFERVVANLREMSPSWG